MKLGYLDSPVDDNALSNWSYVGPYETSFVNGVEMPQGNAYFINTVTHEIQPTDWIWHPGATDEMGNAIAPGYWDNPNYTGRQINSNDSAHPPVTDADFVFRDLGWVDIGGNAMLRQDRNTGNLYYRGAQVFWDDATVRRELSNTAYNNNLVSYQHRGDAHDDIMTIVIKYGIPAAMMAVTASVLGGEMWNAFKESTVGQSLFGSAPAVPTPTVTAPSATITLPDPVAVTYPVSQPPVIPSYPLDSWTLDEFLLQSGINLPDSGVVGQSTIKDLSQMTTEELLNASGYGPDGINIGSTATAPSGLTVPLETAKVAAETAVRAATTPIDLNTAQKALGVATAAIGVVAAANRLTPRPGINPVTGLPYSAINPVTGMPYTPYGGGLTQALGGSMLLPLLAIGGIVLLAGRGKEKGKHHV